MTIRISWDSSKNKDTLKKSKVIWRKSQKKQPRSKR